MLMLTVLTLWVQRTRTRSQLHGKGMGNAGGGRPGEGRPGAAEEEEEEVVGKVGDDIWV